MTRVGGLVVVAGAVAAAPTIALPRDETLVSELTKIRSRTRAGGSAVEVPRTTTSHQDSALALASAVYFLDSKGVPGRARTWSSFKNGRPHIFTDRERRALDEMLIARGVGVVRR